MPGTGGHVGRPSRRRGDGLTAYEARIDTLLEAATRVFMAYGPHFADGLPHARVTLWPEYRRDFADFAQGRVWNDVAQRFETITATARPAPVPAQMSAAETVLAWLGHYIDDPARRRLCAAMVRHRVFRAHGHVQRALTELKLRMHRSTAWRQYRDGMADIVAGVVADNINLTTIEKKLLT